MSQVKSKSAVIFGGSGFIGTHLASELELQGYKVAIADLVSPKDPTHEFHICDVRRRINLDLKNTPEIIFNLAAIHRTPGHESTEYYETNVFGAQNITEWASEKGIGKIVFTSSISVYGPNKIELDESSPTFPVSDYGKSKLMAEEIHSRWQLTDSTSRSIVICRPAVVFGEYENGNFTRLAKALKSRYFFFPGSKETKKACGYVKDAVRSLVFAAESNRASLIYNFCFPRNYSIGEICRTFSKVAKYPTPISLPVAQLGVLLAKREGLMGSLGQRLLKLVYPTNIAPATLVELGFTWKYDLESALTDWRNDSKFDQAKQDSHSLDSSNTQST
jgi:nucleoside-diphosphate-sugar epimerase